MCLSTIIVFIHLSLTFYLQVSQIISSVLHSIFLKLPLHLHCLQFAQNYQNQTQPQAAEEVLRLTWLYVVFCFKTPEFVLIPDFMQHNAVILFDVCLYVTSDIFLLALAGHKSIRRIYVCTLY